MVFGIETVEDVDWKRGLPVPKEDGEIVSRGRGWGTVSECVVL